MAEHMTVTGGSADYRDVAGITRLIFDIDRDGDLEAALRDTRLLVGVLEEAFAVPTQLIGMHFSGGKGFHVDLPPLWNWLPADNLPRVCRIFAESIAGEAKVAIDSSIFSHVSLVRAPNSRHPRTGFHRVRIPHESIDTFTIDEILEMAREPVPFQPSSEATPVIPDLQRYWDSSVAQVGSGRKPRQQDREARLTRMTKDIIRGASLEEGSRHRLLYSAAANLAECGASLPLAIDLLEEVGQESGLRPREVLRQIEYGHERGLK